MVNYFFNELTTNLRIKNKKFNEFSCDINKTKNGEVKIKMKNLKRFVFHCHEHWQLQRAAVINMLK